MYYVNQLCTELQPIVTLLLYNKLSSTHRLFLTTCQGLDVSRPCASGDQIVYAWGMDAPELHLPEGVGFRLVCTVKCFQKKRVKRKEYTFM